MYADTAFFALIVPGKMRGPRLWPLPSIRLVLIAFAFLHIDICLSLHSDDCSPGLDTPGVTRPHGDIVRSVGDSLDIFCKLNLEHNMTLGRNSSHLWFYEDALPVEDHYISIVNETTIHLHIPNVQAGSKMFYCKLMAAEAQPGNLTTGVCLNSVIVGSKPSMVKNFGCYSHNWQNLNCTWKPPDNFIPTKYTVGFKLPTRAGRKKLNDCPTLPQPSKNYCFWDQSTSPLYRQTYEIYYFYVFGENKLGNFTSEQITFNHYAHVIPDPPQQLRAINETPNSVLLQWSIPSPLSNFPGGLNHRIKYQDVFDQTWKLANTTLIKSLTLDNSKYTKVYNLTNLPYANALYDVKVYIKSGKTSVEDRWSLPANVTFRTKQKLPLRPPKTDIGSFEISGVVPTRDIYIYWQRIFDWEQCGDKFEYILQVFENGILKDISPAETTHSYAKFKGISLFNTYKFVVLSNNSVGSSIDSSAVLVPNKVESPSEPQAFTKIAFGNRTYELSWKPPAKDKDIVDYTIFWCDNKNDRPFQCTGFLNWTHVDKSLTIKNITVPEDKIYQFAISANTHNTSSGMIWASCTVLHNKVGKMKSVWIIMPYATYIEVGWKLECSDRIGSVIGFRIYYCRIQSSTSDCRDNEPLLSTIIEGDPLTIRGKITNLKPYTTYRVSVSVLTKNGEGQQSEPQFTTTLEDAPTPPWNISVYNVTNTSAVITWNPPRIPNGFLKNYNVHYNKTQVHLARENTNVTLTGLLSYSKYNVTITACTVKCSNHSISFQTHIGNPGIVERPIVHFLNTSQVLVCWKPPSHPGGEINQYEILVTQIHGTAESNFSQFSYISQGNESQIPIPDCNEGSRKVYRFQVRAINTNNNITYHGPWSEEGEGSCFLQGITRAQTIIIWVTSCVVLSVIVIVGIAMINKICSRIKKMQGVEVKLPPGLDPKGVRIDTGHQRKNFLYEKEKNQDYDMNTWSSEEPREHLSKTLLNTSADEEPFIQKKEDRHGRNPSGDSSGCSSGHESVSSSITSGTQISSDSGTEADQLAASPDGVFPESSRWDCSSLRQTSGSVPADSGWDQYVSMAGSSCGTRSTPNLTDLDSCPPTAPYSCLSTAPAWSSTSYISNEEEFTGPAELQSEYSTVGNEPVFTKPLVKGYVSLAKMGDVSASPNLSQSSSPLWDDSQDSVPALPVSYVMAGEHRANEPSENGPVDQYCRFGLRSTPSPGNPKTTGYVALTDTNALTRPHPTATASTFQPNGYVSHKQFDKKEMTSPIEPDSTPHTKVFSTSENPLKSPPASV